jgi:hypothetical protein
MKDDFDWDDEISSIKIQEIRAIAIYSNARGELVIRQQGGVLHHEDQFVYFPKSELNKLIKALREEKKRLS